MLKDTSSLVFSRAIILFFIDKLSSFRSFILIIGFLENIRSANFIYIGKLMLQNFLSFLTSFPSILVIFELKFTSENLRAKL